MRRCQYTPFQILDKWSPWGVSTVDLFSIKIFPHLCKIPQVKSVDQTFLLKDPSSWKSFCLWNIRENATDSQSWSCACNICVWKNIKKWRFTASVSVLILDTTLQPIYNWTCFYIPLPSRGQSTVCAWHEFGLTNKIACAAAGHVNYTTVCDAGYSIKYVVIEGFKQTWTDK